MYIPRQVGEKAHFTGTDSANPAENGRVRNPPTVASPFVLRGVYGCGDWDKFMNSRGTETSVLLLNKGWI